jgi:signal transduction histidine kinase
VSFGAARPAEHAEPGRRSYQHRFAEPFESLSARLVLAPLPGLGGAGYVYALAGLSMVVAVLGLAAIYRMVGVVVSYAEQRSNFVAAVTHELKTPLTAIRMYGEMLRDGLVPSEAKRDEYHRHITAESERLSRLVDNVLELSRLQNGTRRVRLERGDLGAVCREVATLVAEGAHQSMDDGARCKQVEIVLDEIEAVHHCMSRSNPGDLVVLCVDKHADVLAELETMSNQAQAGAHVGEAVGDPDAPVLPASSPAKACSPAFVSDLKM